MGMGRGKRKLHKIMTAAEAAKGAPFFGVDVLTEKLSISRQRVYAACKEWRVSGGKRGIPHSKPGRFFVFRDEGVSQWLASLENEYAK